MPVTAGPIYPGIKDGLVFAIDPANKDSWAGPTSATVDSLTLYNPLSGSIVNDTSGSYGDNESFDFDGTDDYIELEDLSILSGATEASISLWFNRDANGNYILLDIKDGSNGRLGLQSYLSNSLYIYLNSKSYSVSPSPSISANNWYNMVLVYNGTGSTNADKLKLYLDNTELTGGTYSGTIDSSIGSLSVSGYTEIGRTPSTAYFNGQMGPVLIYNRALSAGEVLQNYNRVKGRFGL